MNFFSKLYQSPAIKWLKIMLFTLTGMLAVLCLSLILILGTQFGTQWLFGLIYSYSDDQFSFQEVHGHLLDTVHITEFEYHNSDISLKINTLQISWQPKKLLQNIFYLERLHLDGIHIKKISQPQNKQNSVPEKKPVQDFVLSDINLPLKIILNELSLSDINWLSSPEEKPLLINSLTAQADANASTINVSKIEVTAAEFKFSTNGKLILNESYPLVMNTDLHLNLKELPQLSSSGIINGDFKKLNIKQSISGELQGNFDINLHDLLSELQWNGFINIKQIPVGLLDNTLVENDLAFDLSLTGEGDLDKATLKPLHLILNDSELILSGKIAWLNDLTWDLALDAQNIDPAVIYPQMPGDINLKLKSRGRQKKSVQAGKDQTQPKSSFADNNLELNLILQSLQGTLLGQPLSGTGRFDLASGLIQVQQLHLASGDANIKVDGNINQKLDLKWQVDIPKLEHLMPEMLGFLKGNGQLSGTHLQPVLEGELNAGKVKFDTVHLNQAKLAFAFSKSEQYSSRASLSIANLSAEKNEIDDLLLNITGTPKAHSVDIKSGILDNRIHVNAKGGYFDAENLWRGTINEMTLKGNVPGHWQQKKPAELLIHPLKATMEQLCLFDQKAGICATLNWQPDKTQADVQIRNIALSRVKPWLPDAIIELGGEMNMNAQITMQQKLKANVAIDLTPGHVSYLLEADKKVRLKHQKGQIQAILSEQALTANWNLRVGEHGIEGDINIPRPALDKDLNQAPISGKIKLDVKELGLLTALNPDIKDAQGYIKADLQLGGVVSEPVITGIAEFVSERISIPVIGITFTQVYLKLKGLSDKRMAVSGQLSSGKGTMNLKGELSLEEHKNWPAKLHFQGEEIEIINLPEFQATISPDVNLEHGIGGIKIKGQVDIAKARIFVNELPENSISESDDVIVIGEEAKKPTNIDLDMVVKLSDDIHLKAFGLNTWLEGQLRIKKSPRQFAIANGELKTTHGTFRAYGQNLMIEQGRISYAGGYLDNPGLNIRASKEVRDLTVGVRATGTAKDIDIGTYASDPGLTTKDIVALLLTGQKLDAAENARVYAGTDLSDDLSVGVNVGAGDEGSELAVQYKLRKNMHLEGISSAKKSGVNLIYTIEID